MFKHNFGAATRGAPSRMKLVTQVDHEVHSWPCDFSAMCDLLLSALDQEGIKPAIMCYCSADILDTCGVLSVEACVELSRLPSVSMVSEVGSQRTAAVRDRAAGDR
jgi:hypothetical protein